MTRIMFSSVLVLVAMVGLNVAAAGTSVPIGSLVGSKNTVLDGQPALPHTALLSGDNLHVGDGVAVVTLERGNRMLLGRNTEASFLAEMDGVTVSMTRGNMSLYHPEASRAFRVKIGGVTVTTRQGSRALGEIATLNGLLQVTAKEGVLEVEKAGTTEEVGTGKTITIATADARTGTPNPAGKQHIKHIHISISPKTILILGGAAETAGIITAIVVTRSSAPAVSPVLPTP